MHGQSPFNTQNLRAKLRNSCSAVAICAVLTAPSALAEDKSARLIIEGYGGWIYGDAQPWGEFFDGVSLPQLQEIRPESNYGGRLGLILPDMTDEWDAGVFARFGRTNSEKDGGTGNFFFNVLGGYYPTFYFSGNAKHEEEHVIVDFEARRDVGLGSDSGIQATAIAGLRFGYFSADTQTEFYYSPLFTLNDTRKSEFLGAGPRVGLEGLVPLATGVSLQLAGSASVLYGRRNVRVRTTAGLPFLGGSANRSEDEFVTTLDARTALQFAIPGSSALLSVGVEGTAWYGAFDQRTTGTLFGPPAGGRTGDRYSVNPFVSLTVPIGVDKVSTVNAFASDDSTPFARMQPVVQGEISYGYNQRNGNALNASGPPMDEADDFGLFGGNLLGAMPIGPRFLVQGEVSSSRSSVDGDNIDDTFDRSFTYGGHFAFTSDKLLLGIFGGAGQTDIHDDGVLPHDADFDFFGAEGRVLCECGSIAVQAGYLDASSADLETMSNGIFGRIIGQKFFSEGRAKLQGEFSYAAGTQDEDQGFFTDGVEIYSWGVEFEHQIPVELGAAKGSWFVGYEGLRVEEYSTSGGTDSVSDNQFMAGLRFRLGGENLYEREQNTAPGLPKIARWLGAVPAVD